MDNEEELIKRMYVTTENNDKEGIKEIIKYISKDFNFSKYDWIEDLFLGPKLDARTKIKFCLSTLDIKNDENVDTNNFFSRQVIPGLLSECIEKNEDEFVDLVTKDENMQELLVGYIREHPYDSMQIWYRISNLPLVKKRILEDEDFISGELNNEGIFFENLPQEYSHLICYYNARFNEFDFEFMNSLYEKYFGKLTDKKEQTLLIGLHYILEKRNSIGVNPKIAMQPLLFTLKGVLEDADFLKKIEDFQRKLDIDFASAVFFSSNYYNTELYDELMNRNEIDDILKEKVSYLSNVDRIAGVDTLDDLNSASIDELKDMEKEPIYVSELLSTGGPNSKTTSTIFLDSSYREVRSIKWDGNTKKQVVGNQESHEGVVEKIYEDDIEFSDSCKTVWQRSIECAKQISAVTLAIECEQCHMYMPSNISPEQSKVLMKLIDCAADNGRFGIAVYDHKKDKTYLSGIDLLDKDETKKFLARLNEKALQEAIKEGKVISAPAEDNKGKINSDDGPDL